MNSKNKHDYQYIKNYINNENYILVDQIYINNAYKMHMICPKGHDYYCAFSAFISGSRCPICNKNKKNFKSYLYFIKILENENYKMLSSQEDFLTKKTKLLVECPHGHQYLVSYDKFIHGKRCSKCANNKKYTNNEIKKELAKYGLKLLSDNYKNNKSKIKVSCANGHIYNTTLISIKRYKHCKYCYGYAGEKKVIEILIKNKINYIEQKRFKNCKDKYPLPFDFYLPKYNLCIEYDGQQHFDVKHNIKGWKSFIEIILHDAIKNQFCEDNKINILRIPFWEFDNIEELINKKINELRINFNGHVS